jgi:hypothetical protein
MARITRTQQRQLVASSIAFILMAAIVMATTTNARGDGRNVGVLGFTHPDASPSPQISIARGAFSHRQTAFRHSRVIGAPFFTLGVGGVWIDNSRRTPMVVVTHPPVILQQQPVPSPAAVKTPSAAEQGIIVVRGDNKSYVTFPTG